ncbi:MAG: type II toxin-antitoxin system death-on-curing family toxin [Gloeotrichia echinulata IR180]
MRYLTLKEVLELYHRLIEHSGGSAGISNIGGLESALAQPCMTFGGEELYPTIIKKASALGFSLIKNHPFIDGNKRIGHAAMEVFLVLNGFEIDATVDEQEEVILQLAAGELGRDEFTEWLRSHIIPKFGFTNSIDTNYG